jgi:class I fructose-bisphosphate aldolase
MTILGKRIRLERIINRDTGKTVIVPMDHGISVGPIDGLLDMKTIIQKVAEGGANATVIHKGLVSEGHREKGQDIGLILHLSASTSLSPYPNAKTLVCSVEEAVKLGADAVSIHVNLGNGGEKEMLNDFGKVSYDEMGADIVKVSYTGSTETFKEVVAGCSVPVVIAGGAKMDSDRDILEMVKGAIDAGGGGVSIGRNVFQHKHPDRMVRAISGIVNDGISVEEGLKILE